LAKKSHLKDDRISQVDYALYEFVVNIYIPILATLLKPFGFLANEDFKLFGFQIFCLQPFLMKVIPETGGMHMITFGRKSLI
jgi:hypothetical protein